MCSLQEWSSQTFPEACFLLIRLLWNNTREWEKWRMCLSLGLKVCARVPEIHHLRCTQPEKYLLLDVPPQLGDWWEHLFLSLSLSPEFCLKMRGLRCVITLNRQTDCKISPREWNLGVCSFHSCIHFPAVISSCTWRINRFWIFFSRKTSRFMGREMIKSRRKWRCQEEPCKRKVLCLPCQVKGQWETGEAHSFRKLF